VHASPTTLWAWPEGGKSSDGTQVGAGGRAQIWAEGVGVEAPWAGVASLSRHG